ncbi:hypothetical protein MRX96_059223 [Rhipicephalus microplus]
MERQRNGEHRQDEEHWRVRRHETDRARDPFVGRTRGTRRSARPQPPPVRTVARFEPGGEQGLSSEAEDGKRGKKGKTIYAKVWFARRDTFDG